MRAYNPKTGQTISIGDSGFSILQNKGWIKAEDQTPEAVPQPTSDGNPLPVVDMAKEMEKRKAEISAKKDIVVEAVAQSIVETAKPKVKLAKPSQKQIKQKAK
jgi:hypothetical protein